MCEYSHSENDGTENTRGADLELVFQVRAGGVRDEGLPDAISIAGNAREYSQEETAGGAGQKRFLAGLDALGKLDADFVFEESKRAYIGGFADAPVLLVQGPPGTGKSYATAFAILARMQNAIEENREFRIFCGCKTHAATDVLIEKVAQMQEKLREVKTQRPRTFRAVLRRAIAPRSAVSIGTREYSRRHRIAATE